MTRIAALTAGGEGRATDGTIHPRTLPGEEVEAGPDGRLRILVPSPDRVAPPCPHFRSCGGCAMQHASDALVAEWKAGVVRRALMARGIEAEIAGVATSPPGTRRRAKLSARRTKKGALVGFHARASDMVVAVPDCRILSPGLMALLEPLEELTGMATSRKGELSLTVTDTETGTDVRVDGGRPLDRALREALGEWAGRAGIARLSWGLEPVAALRPPVLPMGRARVVPPPGAFLQATREGQAALVAAVRGALAGATRVADLFSGCGTFALPLAEAAEVHAVETETEMLAALDRGWRGTPGLRRMTTEVRDLFRRPLLAGELDRFDAAVLDPPRAGAEAQVTEIARSGLARVAMVSCNPVTFARDAQVLVAAGFRPGPVTVVDQFRWSAHVELVAAFARGS